MASHNNKTQIRTHKPKYFTKETLPEEDEEEPRLIGLNKDAS